MSDDAVEKKGEGEINGNSDSKRSTFIKIFSVVMCKTSFISDCLELKACFLNL